MRYETKNVKKRKGTYSGEVGPFIYILKGEWESSISFALKSVTSNLI